MAIEKDEAKYGRKFPIYETRDTDIKYSIEDSDTESPDVSGSPFDAAVLLDASAEKASVWFSNRGLQLPKLVQTITDAYISSIAQESDSVNRKFSISEENVSESSEPPDVSKSETDTEAEAEKCLGEACSVGIRMWGYLWVDIQQTNHICRDRRPRRSK